MSENKLQKSNRNFFVENNKSIGIIVVAILALVSVYFWYQNVYLKNRSSEAADKLANVEQYIGIDSLNNKALNGEGGNAGLLKIASDYENTKSANLANYFIGSIYLKQGKFKEASEVLQKYSPSGSPVIDPLALGLLGDAYSEMKDYQKALDAYQKAASKSSNNLTTPLFLKKSALVKEALKDFKGALEDYKKIKSTYPQSNEGKNIDAYISEVETLAGN